MNPHVRTPDARPGTLCGAKITGRDLSAFSAQRRVEDSDGRVTICPKCLHALAERRVIDADLVFKHEGEFYMVFADTERGAAVAESHSAIHMETGFRGWIATADVHRVMRQLRESTSRFICIEG